MISRFWIQAPWSLGMPIQPSSSSFWIFWISFNAVLYLKLKQQFSLLYYTKSKHLYLVAIRPIDSGTTAFGTWLFSNYICSNVYRINGRKLNFEFQFNFGSNFLPRLTHRNVTLPFFLTEATTSQKTPEWSSDG